MNQSIELYERCRSKDYTDTLLGYQNRGLICFYMGDYEQVIKDNEIVQQRGCKNKELNAVSYYNAATAYGNLGKYAQAINAYAKAYYIWEDCDQKESKDMIQRAMQQLYFEEYENENNDFESWFNDSIKKISEELDENGLPKQKV